MNSIIINETLDLPSDMTQPQAFCGFTLSVDEHVQHNLDLHKYLIRHPAATYFMRAEGDALQELGILHSDLLIIDRSLTPQHNSIIVVTMQGVFKLKILYIIGGKEFLNSAQQGHKPIAVANFPDLQFWGVVTHAIHDVRAS